MSEADLAAVAVVRDEPPERLLRMVDCLKAQDGVTPFPLVIAGTAADAEAVAQLEAGQAVAGIHFVLNPSGGRSTGLNLAVHASNAKIVCRVDARSLIPEGYVAALTERLRDPRVGLAGATQRAVPGTDNLVARAIARGLRHPLGLGGAAYRRNAGGSTDTVYLGAFRTSDLLAVGGYDEELLANEDFDLATRLRAGGKIVWLESDLVVDYEARSDLRSLWRQYEAFGRAKAGYWLSGRGRPNVRQALALSTALLVSGWVAHGRPLRRGLCALASAIVGAEVTNDDRVAARSTAERLLSDVALLTAQAAWLVGVGRGAFHHAGRSS